jgi:hypothetical protein
MVAKLTFVCALRALRPPISGSRVWDKNKAGLNNQGGVKSFVRGQNPLDHSSAALMNSDPVEFHRRVMRVIAGPRAIS